MPLPAIGDAAPDFVLPAADGSQFRLFTQRGRWVVLYFYPQDDTEGCTLENQEFSQLLPEFEALGATVAGISPDSVESHCRFRDKFGLGVPLLADPELLAVQAFGLWQPKKLWGVEYMGLVRTSFLIDPEGRIAATVKATRIRDHARKVLETLRSCQD
jgi:peroxiredoxin Q/BCP